ncbi:FecR/PupR family sigma factor regulator [Pseudomonas aeruginosa]|uniref:FecR/PupR family sigma factor regulator n=1 Tax=Pseudomonas aeruginosa TaxID=287 RepID=UPI001A9D631D|nr:DUF4880 domain-containing protein [Pseudomonas aeruginosa]
MSEKPERQRIVEEAIEWMVRLQSGDFSVAEGDALERWKALSSEHAEVFRQLLGSLAPLQDSPWRGQPSATVLRALEQPSSRRRFVGGALGLFVLLAGGAGLERWVQAGMGLPGELATGTGERRALLRAFRRRRLPSASNQSRRVAPGSEGGPARRLRPRLRRRTGGLRQRQPAAGRGARGDPPGDPARQRAADHR